MSWIQTYSGKQFWPLEPKVEDIEVRDIAHSLSLLCRFNGHCNVFYSVAEHSVRVSFLLDGPLALWGLLHDAAEAYLGDLTRPLKGEAQWFQEVERALLTVIARRFELQWPMPSEVQRADDIMLATEARDLMMPPPVPWPLSVEPLPERIEPWSAVMAEAAFLDRFVELSLRPEPT